MGSLRLNKWYCMGLYDIRNVLGRKRIETELLKITPLGFLYGVEISGFNTVTIPTERERERENDWYRRDKKLICIS